MNCLFRRNDSEQVQKAVSIMTGGESASKKPSVIRLSLATTYANQLKTTEIQLPAGATFFASIVPDINNDREAA
jgi:hypothetical protein